MALGRKNTGKFQVSGLSTAIKITTMDVGDTETAIPATALTDRNSITIYNSSPTETLYIGPTGVQASTALGTTSGWEVGPNESLNFDIQDSIIVYGIAPAGETIRLKIMELA